MSLGNIIRRCLFYQYSEETEGFVLENNDLPVYDVRTEETTKKNQKIYSKIEDNKTYIKKRFYAAENDDLVIRDISLNGDTKCFLVFYDGMCSGDKINEGIIKYCKGIV